VTSSTADYSPMTLLDGQHCCDDDDDDDDYYYYYYFIYFLFFYTLGTYDSEGGLKNY